jgi:hypothetical protein
MINDDCPIEEVTQGTDHDLYVEIASDDLKSLIDLTTAQEITATLAGMTGTITKTKTAAQVTAVSSDVIRIRLLVADTQAMLLKAKQSFYVTVLDQAGKTWIAQFTACLTVLAPRVG